jgi:outer membrane lipoprotein-sorting protein
MALTRRRRSLALVAAVALLVVGGASALGRASPAPSLPPVSADDLIASVLSAMAARPPISGHVSAHLDIGIPALPDRGPAGATGAAELLSALTGNHRLRVWRSPDGLRVSDLLPFGERSIFVSRTEAWAWDSSSFSAIHVGPFAAPPSDSSPGAFDLADPLELARRGIEAISPTTFVTVAGTGRVAGRGVYVLAIEPRTSATLVGRIEISIDAERRLPLRAAVYAREAGSASVSVAFTSVSFGPVDPDVFRFAPPEGAKVVSLSADGNGRGREEGDYGFGPEGPVRVFGDGWTTIVALRIPPLAARQQQGEGFDLTSLLPFSGPLLSVRAVDRDDHAWLVYGAVPQSALDAIEPELS